MHPDQSTELIISKAKIVLVLNKGQFITFGVLYLRALSICLTDFPLSFHEFELPLTYIPLDLVQHGYSGLDRDSEKYISPNMIKCCFSNLFCLNYFIPFTHT